MEAVLTPPHKYLALPAMNYVRILTVEPGSNDDPIRCHLKVIPLHEAHCQYEAISYVWGNHENLVPIKVDGQTILVTENLRFVLRKFREPDKQRPLWADAVCINQGNRLEKSHQVRRMAEIYKRARRVLCWLGHDDDRVAEGCFKLVEKANKLLAEQWNEGWTFENIYDLKLPGLHPDDEKAWPSFKRLLDLPWFERLWVVQESGLARECLAFWGDSEVQYYEIIELASWVAYSVHAPKLSDGIRTGRVLVDVFLDIQCTYDNEPNWRGSAPLATSFAQFYPESKQLYVDLLFSARSLKVTDARDTVYSSLGSPLAIGPDGHLMVEPDYDEGLDDLYIRTAHALLKNPREAPHLLLRVIHGMEEPVNFPTWVPRWVPFPDNSPRLIPLAYTYEYRIKPYRACGTELQFAFKTEANKLMVTGTIIDTLTWCSFPLKSGDLRSDIDSWEPRFRDGKMSAIEVIWRALLEETSLPTEHLIKEYPLTLARGRPSENNLDNFLAYCELLRSIVESEDSSPFPLPEPGQGVASDGEWMVTRSRDRRVGWTTHNRLALVPFTAQVGDACCIIQGMDVPVVLRKVSDGEYELVGEAYVHGVMDGELLLPDVQDFLHLESICIR